MVVHARGRCGRVSRSSSVYVCVRVCVCVWANAPNTQRTRLAATWFSTGPGGEGGSREERMEEGRSPG